MALEVVYQAVLEDVLLTVVENDTRKTGVENISNDTYGCRTGQRGEGSNLEK